MGLPSLIYAANAMPDNGGLGKNLSALADTLKSHFELDVLSQGEITGATNHIYTSGQWLKKKQHFYQKLGRVDWTVESSFVDYDRWVCETLEKLESYYLVGAVGQCFKSLEQFKQRTGSYLVLDVVNHHIQEFSEIVAREFKPFSLSTFLPPSIINATLSSYEYADCIRVMSTRSRDTFLAAGLPASKIKVVTPSIEVPSQFTQKSNNGNFRIAYGGQLTPWKGLRYLVDAFSAFTNQDAELKFYGFTGSRPIRKYFEEVHHQDKRISVEPIVLQEKNIYSEIDVWVHPSLSDGFAYTVVEAMAVGVPAIVTEETGAAQWIQDGVNGFVVPAADATALRDRIDYCYHHRDEIKQMGIRAREAVKKHTFLDFQKEMLDCFVLTDKKRAAI